MTSVIPIGTFILGMIIGGAVAVDGDVIAEKIFYIIDKINPRNKGGTL